MALTATPIDQSSESSEPVSPVASQENPTAISNSPVRLVGRRVRAISPARMKEPPVSAISVA